MKTNVQHSVLFDEATIRARVGELGREITRDFQGESIVCIGVLKGAAMFLADLIRTIDLPVHLEFIGVASYSGTQSTGHVRLTHDLSADIEGKNVVLVEDIVDTGYTLDYLIDTLKVRSPKSLKVATLLSKAEAREMHNPIDYVGFEISGEFVVGYGLDLDQACRNLPYIGQIHSSSAPESS